MHQWCFCHVSTHTGYQGLHRVFQGLLAGAKSSPGERQKVMQELNLQAAQNQQGTERCICEKHHDCWEALSWGASSGRSEGLRTGTGKCRGSERLKQGPGCSICLSYYVDKCPQKLYKTVFGRLCLRRYCEAVGG